MTKREKETKQITRYINRVIRKKHEEHRRLPKDKLHYKGVELRNYLLEA